MKQSEVFKQAMKETREFFEGDSAGIAALDFIEAKVELINAGGITTVPLKQPEQKQEGCGWVFCSERLPQNDRNYFVQAIDGGTVVKNGAIIRAYHTSYTQWLDYQDPKLVKSEEDKAFETLADSFDNRWQSLPPRDLAQHFWNAAIAHAKGGK